MYPISSCPQGNKPSREPKLDDDHIVIDLFPLIKRTICREKTKKLKPEAVSPYKRYTASAIKYSTGQRLLDALEDKGTTSTVREREPVVVSIEETQEEEEVVEEEEKKKKSKRRERRSRRVRTREREVGEEEEERENRPCRGRSLAPAGWSLIHAAAAAIDSRDSSRERETGYVCADGQLA